MQTAGKDGTTRRLMDRVVELKTVNAELLKALETILKYDGDSLTLLCRKKARAAIAKAKGGE